MTLKQSDTVFRALTWLASTILSAGIAWGSIQQRVVNLEKQADINRLAIIELQKQTNTISEMRGLLQEHVRWDSKGK